MNDLVIGLIALAIAAPLMAWLGIALGRKAAKRSPGFAAALWILSTFIKIDPPPPPKAERVVKDDGAAGDPPRT